MEKISQILAKVIDKLNLNKEAKSAWICFEASKISEGEFSPVSFKNGLLTIRVPNLGKASQIQAESYKIIKKINQKVGQEIVKKLRFRIGQD